MKTYVLIGNITTATFHISASSWSLYWPVILLRLLSCQGTPSVFEVSLTWLNGLLAIFLAKIKLISIWRYLSHGCKKIL